MNTYTFNGASINGPAPLAYTPPPVPVVVPLRDRPILRLIRDALAATGEFDEVGTSGLPEDSGSSAESARLAALELGAFKEAVLYSESYGVSVERTVHFTLTIAARDNDPDTRDDEADRLYSVAANSINGNSYGGLTVPDKTYLSTGTYHAVLGVERRLKVPGQFVYLIPSWNTRDTTSTS